MNNVCLLGRIANEIELRYTPNGKPIAKFSLAVDKRLGKEKRIEAEMLNHPTADFFNIVVWGKQGEFILENTEKGKLIAVNGRLENRSYVNKEEKKIYITEIIAETINIVEWKKKKEKETSKILKNEEEAEEEEEEENNTNINNFIEPPRKTLGE